MHLVKILEPIATVVASQKLTISVGQLKICELAGTYPSFFLPRRRRAERHLPLGFAA
jgi:hypothetical protein